MSNSLFCPQGSDAGNFGPASYVVLAASLHRAASCIASLGELCTERLRSDVGFVSVDFLVVLQGLVEVNSARLAAVRAQLRPTLPLGHPVVDLVRLADAQLHALLALIGAEFATSSAPAFLTITQAVLARARSLLNQSVDQLGALATLPEAA